jgi:PHD finger-like domain-containing protein 5A
MAKHHPDLILCRKQPGIAIGRLCERHDGQCVICDSFVRPCTLVRVCDECNYGSFQGRCVICGGAGVADAYYCKECTTLEKDVQLPLSRSSSMMTDPHTVTCRGTDAPRS